MCPTQHLNYGNFDRAVMAYSKWVATRIQEQPWLWMPPWAWELTFDVTRQWGLSLETNYLAGQSNLPLTGSYSGGTLGGTITTVPGRPCQRQG